MTVRTAAQAIGNTKIVIANGKRKTPLLNPREVEDSKFSDMEVLKIENTRKAVWLYV